MTNFVSSHRLHRPQFLPSKFLQSGPKMASSSALSFSTFPSTSCFKDVVPSSSSPSTLLHRFSDRYPPPSPSRSASLTAKSFNSSGNLSGDDLFGFYPWESAAGGIEWEQQETITLFTADGLVQIGGSMVTKRMSSSQKKQSRVKASPRLQQFKESNYMDPAQGLCLGALFDIAATNGLDMGRRLCIIGFCHSIEMLSDVVEDTVLQHGGEACTCCA